MSEHRKWSFGSAPAAEVSLKELEHLHNALYDAWDTACCRATETLDENNRLDRELDEARKHIAELESPIRVPFTDAQIERMAKAYYEARWDTGKWARLSPNDQASTKSAVRAALSAGGLEPCAVPEHDPADVALIPNDDEVEKLAQVLTEAWGGSTKLYLESWRSAARAAIAHLRPTQGHVLRDGLVDAERKVENQRAELKRLNALVSDLRESLAALHTGETVEGVMMERDLYRIRLERAEVKLRERDSVPVKVRWDVSDEDIAGAMFGGYYAELITEKEGMREWLRAAKAGRDYLAAHAVIDAPAGVPSVEELGILARDTFARHMMDWDDVAHAIRHAVLAGVADEQGERKCLGCGAYYIGKFCTYCNPAPVWTDAEIEKLARALRAAFCGADEWDVANGASKGWWDRVSRAAIEYMRVARPDPTITMIGKTLTADDFDESAGTAKQPDGLPDLDEIDGIRDFELQQIYHSAHPGTTIYGDGLIAVRKAILTALRPWLREPTAKDKRLIVPGGVGTHGRDCFAKTHPNIKWNDCDEFTKGYWSGVAHIVPNPTVSREDFIAIIQHEVNRGTPLADALGFMHTNIAPFLHEPTGWKLDVTAQEALDEYCKQGWAIDCMQAVLNLCRSRIKPVYGCKECAKLEEQHQDLISISNDEVARIKKAIEAINAARAALEGE